MRKEGGSDIVKDENRGKQRKTAVVLTAVIFLVGTAGKTRVTAADGPGALCSKGVVQCEQAVIDAADLRNMHAYVSGKRKDAAGILIQLGTKFRQESGGIVYDRNPETEQGEIDLSQISWPVLTQAAVDSQNVPEGLPVLHPENALRIEGVEEYTDSYRTAVADNISRGKAAWADGDLLLGNGADNDKAYQAGMRDGENGSIPESLYPIFSVKAASIEIRHMHVGEQAKTEGVSGCYQNSKETKVEEKRCSASLKKTEATWYPNPDEPGGGSWHGGNYTCPNHGGSYDSPGTCRHKTTVSTTVWHHDIICGLTDVLYARLDLGGSDTDYTDQAVRLEAYLEPGDGYEQLIWSGEEQLVWMNENREPLGTGTELFVQEPGNYWCGLSVSNEDIDLIEACAEVKVSGFVLRN